ncbi:hypothetical protein AB0O47_39130 [Streptomyces noursei]|uniref:hypothetical protein n=1 Tax=Streptomyces noursei TaxID=1971 RepID=UPI00344EDCCD
MTTIDPVDVADELTARKRLRRWMSRQPDLYEFRGTLHRWDADAEEGAGALVMMDADAFADYCADRIDTVKVSTTTTRGVLLPSRLAKALLRVKGAGLRHVVSVDRLPVVRPDGTIASSRGYDPVSRRIVAPVVDIKPVPDSPTVDDVGAARGVLRELFGAFPYAEDSDYAHTIGMYLAPMLRGFLPESARAPLHVVTATGPGSGKSYLSAEGLEALYGARRMSAEQSGRELQKTLIAALEKDTGAAVVAFDNFVTGGRVTGPQWAKWITEPVISGRVIGTGRTPEIPNRFLWTVNGNQIRVGEDMGRRSVVISLASTADDPSQVAHSFDFLEELVARRSEVLWALLVLVRHWTSKPADVRPVRKVQLGQFSAWMTAVASILDAGGIGGFNENRDARMAAMDEQAAEFTRFYTVVREVIGGGWFRASKVSQNPQLQDLIPRAADGADRRIGHRLLGRGVLRPQVGRMYGGMRVEERWDAHAKSFLYRIVSVEAQRVAKTARAVVETVKGSFAPVRLARLMDEGRRRRAAARVVRVESADYARAAKALAGFGAVVRQ